MGALGSSCLGIAAFLQLAAGLVMGYYVQQVIEDHSEELSVRREQDDEIWAIELAVDEERERTEKWTSWPVLPCYAKCILIFGVICTEAMLVVFAFGKTLFHSAAFKEFDPVTDTVSKD